MYIIELDDDEVVVLINEIQQKYLDDQDELDDDEDDDVGFVLATAIVDVLDVIELDIELDDDDDENLLLILDDVDINEQLLYVIIQMVVIE